MKICTSNLAEYIIIEDFFEQHELSGIWRETAAHTELNKETAKQL